MSSLLLTEEVGRGVAMWLAQGVWQTSLVALVAGVGLWLLRHRSAQVRYAVGCVALALLVLAPSVTLWWSAPTPARGSLSSVKKMGGGRELASVAAVSPVAGSAFAPPVESQVRPEGVSFVSMLPFALVALWLAGACVGLLRLVLGWRRASRQWVRPATPAAMPLRRTVSQVAERLGLRRPVKVMESPFAPSPLVLGVVRPLLILPRGVSERLAPEQLEAVLAHELAHVRRHDTFANFAQCLVETLFFFHPAARWLSSRVRLEREHCCDDTAVALCGNVRMYSGALLGLEELRQAGPGLGAGSQPLVGRVRRLLGHAPVAEPPRKARRALQVGGVLAVLAASGAAWAWEVPEQLVSREQVGFAAASCSRVVYPADFTAIASYQSGGRTLRNRLFVSRCGRILLESADGSAVQSVLYDVSSMERVFLDARERTFDVVPRDGDLGLPLHLPGGCSEQKANCQLQGEDVVAGMRTQRWLRVYAPHDTVTQWVDVELGYPIREESDLFGVLTLSDIQVAVQDPMRFVIPSHYRAESIP